MKLPLYFTANAASCCFTSVALKCKPNAHICGENSASAAAICLQDCGLTVNVSIVYLQIASIMSRRVWAAKLLYHYGWYRNREIEI